MTVDGQSGYTPFPKESPKGEVRDEAMQTRKVVGTGGRTGDVVPGLRSRHDPALKGGERGHPRDARMARVGEAGGPSKQAA